MWNKLASGKFSQLSTKEKVGVGVAGAAILGGTAYMLYKYNKRSCNIDDPGFEDNVYLTWDEAKARAEIVSDVRYELILALAKGKSYYGKIKVSFHLENTDFKEEDLFLDFHGRSVRKLRVNGQKQDIK